jgi:hypothetical protein
MRQPGWFLEELRLEWRRIMINFERYPRASDCSRRTSQRLKNIKMFLELTEPKGKP